MVGGQGPSHIAIWKYLLDKNIPDVLVHDWMSEYVKPLRHTLFMAWYTHDSDGEFHGRYVVRHFKGKKVCWLTADMASTEQWQIASERAIKEENEKVKKEDQITIGINAKIDRLAAQANSEILKFQKEGCDIVMLNTQGNSVGASAINFAANQGYFPKWTMGWANITSSFSKLVNKKSQEGVIATSPFALDDGMGAKDFSKFRDFAQKHNIEVAGNGARGFYVAEVFVEALRRTGKELTAEKFLATLEQMTGYVCSLCVTPLEWSPTNHQAITKEIVLTVHDGKWVRASD
jgi:ABC-type branched-subunit amino acid transport system substrate-binding protein